MNATQLINNQLQSISQLDEVVERHAYGYAMETLGLSPEDAFIYAKERANIVVDAGDDD